MRYRNTVRGISSATWYHCGTHHICATAAIYLRYTWCEMSLCSEQWVQCAWNVHVLNQASILIECDWKFGRRFDVFYDTMCQLSLVTYSIWHIDPKTARQPRLFWYWIIMKIVIILLLLLLLIIIFEIIISIVREIGQSILQPNGNCWTTYYACICVLNTYICA